ncbi:unnamed protein product [Microthlaspi erraticum]|uniref:RNase H type-1 domain-containing protein n=1 Tax=Microthlaspi erraticum TaxID=1685480 RepID=A0A6D2KK63_9BRAS|nr:unnamed protein product [Microthlaspi erraticum]
MSSLCKLKRMVMKEVIAISTQATVDKTVEENVITNPVVQTDQIITLPRCQTDPSWSTDCNLFGSGFVIDQENDERILGAMAEYQVSTPLHAELAALVWAMKNA